MKQNILIINDDESVVSYVKSDVSNTSTYKINLDELVKIFNENHEDIYKYDTSGCLLLILKDERKISLNQYRLENLSINDIMFFEINDLYLGENNEILLYNDDKYMQPEKAYQLSDRIIDSMSYYTDFNVLKKTIDNDVRQNINGYINTLNLKKRYVKTPAIDYCLSQQIKTISYTYKGYIPSFCQLWIFSFVLPVLEYLKGHEYYHDYFMGGWWSSTETSAYKNYFWTIRNDQGINREPIEIKAYTSYNVLPAFKRFIN